MAQRGHPVVSTHFLRRRISCCALYAVSPLLSRVFCVVAIFIPVRIVADATIPSALNGSRVPIHKTEQEKQ